MLVLAALCALCSVTVTMATQLLQDSLTLTRRTGQTASISCGQIQQCDSNLVDWFQKKDTETFKGILDIDKRDGKIYSNYYNHPQKDDFTAELKENGCNLLIRNVKREHSATYFCACWKYVDWSFLIFGSGTKLFVTDEAVVKPVVSVYPAASWLHMEQKKTSLLCLASDMFPPLVKFSWMRQKKKNGLLEDLHPADGEQLELTESGRTAGVLLIDQTEAVTYQHRCIVHHEGGPVEAPSAQDEDVPAEASCPSDRNPTNSSVLLHHDLFFQSELRVKLFCFFYILLTVKSLLFSCGLALISISTNGHVHTR